MSLGSAAWAEWLVDGDLAHEIDAREIPDDWSTGYTPLDRDRPYQKPRPDTSGAVFHLDPGLVSWAYSLTRDVELLDTPGLRRVRRLYADFPGARRPPFVLRGDNVASMTFWHGRLMTEWARRWLGYWTGGRGTFATTAQEDTGTALALRSLAAAGKVDARRFLVLRTASNPSMQFPGISAAQSLALVNDGDYAGFEPSLDSAYRVGSPVVNEIVRHWSRYRDELPGAAPSRP